MLDPEISNRKSHRNIKNLLRSFLPIHLTLSSRTLMRTDDTLNLS